MPATRLCHTLAAPNFEVSAHKEDRSFDARSRRQCLTVDRTQWQGDCLQRAILRKSSLLGRLETSGFGRLEVDILRPELLKLEPGEVSSGSRGGCQHYAKKRHLSPGAMSMCRMPIH